MVRRIAIELSIGLGSPFTPDPETLERYAQAVDYVSSLEGQALDGFWLIRKLVHPLIRFKINLP